MKIILEGLLKGLVLWIYGLILEGVSHLANSLLTVFSMDLAYFETYAPVTTDIINVILATGWALLIGNLVFQSMRSMASGIGFDGEDPKFLFMKTSVFSFLLLASRQICDIGLGITGRTIEILQIPDAVSITTPDESHFGFIDSAWLWVIIIGLILIYQILKFFFEIAERYVVLSVLTIMAPLAFAMGGSKNTEDIFKGWARMYGSMCLMMLMNVVFLKLLLSAMSTIPTGAGLFPWLLFVVAIARVGRKVDDLIARIGLSPARTGDPLGRGVPMMLTMMVARSMGRNISNTYAKANGGAKAFGAAGATASGPSPRPNSSNPSGGEARNSTGFSQGNAYTNANAQTNNQNSTQHSSTSSAQQNTGGASSTVSQSSAQTSSQHSATSNIGAMAGVSGAVMAGAMAGSTRGVNVDIEKSPHENANPISQGQRPINIIPNSQSVGNNLSQVSSPSENIGGATSQPLQRNNSDEQKQSNTPPARPPIQRTPRGNFPQAPVGVGVTTPVSHDNSNTQNISNDNHSSSQTTPISRNNVVTTVQNRPSAAQPQSTNGSVGAVSHSVQSSAIQMQGGNSGDIGANRPPIGHNAVSNIHSTESLPTSNSRNGAQAPVPSIGRNIVSNNNSTVESQTTSHGRNDTPQSVPTSHGRNDTPQSVPTSHGRNDTPQSVPISHGRNDTPQSVPTSHGRNDTPQSVPLSNSRNSVSQNISPMPIEQSNINTSPTTLGKDEPFKRPPIGHNRSTPEVKK